MLVLQVWLKQNWGAHRVLHHTSGELLRPGNVWHGWNICKEAMRGHYMKLKPKLHTSGCLKCQNHGAWDVHWGKLQTQRDVRQRERLCVLQVAAMGSWATQVLWSLYFSITNPRYYTYSCRIWCLLCWFCFVFVLLCSDFSLLFSIPYPVGWACWSCPNICWNNLTHVLLYRLIVKSLRWVSEETSNQWWNC